MSVAADLLLFTVAFRIEGQPMGDSPIVIGRMPLKFCIGDAEASWSLTLFSFDPVVALGSWQIGLAQVLREATPGWQLGRVLDLMSAGHWVGPAGQRVGCCVLLEQTFLPPSVMYEDWSNWRQRWEKLSGEPNE
jgi:hypothetical protein